MSKCIILTLLFFFFQYSGYHRDLHSFPTRRSSDLVYRLAYRLAGDDELAREFTQDTFVRAFERLDSFRGEARLSTWLHAITTSVVLNGLRKVKRFRHRETDLAEATEVSRGRRQAVPDLKRRLAVARGQRKPLAPLGRRHRRRAGAGHRDRSVDGAPAGRKRDPAGDRRRQ